jgi:2-phosphoglycerate kinase
MACHIHAEINNHGKPQHSPILSRMDSSSETLRHVYWIGGGSGSGKSTVARRLAAHYGLHHYASDETMRDHAHRTSSADRPFSCAFEAMSMDERWLNRSPNVMLETFHFFRGECFGRIVEDLMALPPDRRVVVEGFGLLPALVKPLLYSSNQSVWRLPTPEFRHAAFKSRGTLWHIAGKTSNPARALQNLLLRDALFTDHLSQETQTASLPTIEVDRSTTEDTLVHQIATQFGL